MIAFIVQAYVENFPNIAKRFSYTSTILIFSKKIAVKNQVTEVMLCRILRLGIILFSLKFY